MINWLIYKLGAICFCRFSGKIVAKTVREIQEQFTDLQMFDEQKEINEWQIFHEAKSVD
ncbi:MAG: hypothetical protein WBA93_10810 [Microcoleaceae cyanobacterium]